MHVRNCVPVESICKPTRLLSIQYCPSAVRACMHLTSRTRLNTLITSPCVHTFNFFGYKYQIRTKGTTNLHANINTHHTCCIMMTHELWHNHTYYLHLDV